MSHHLFIPLVVLGGLLAGLANHDALAADAATARDCAAQAPRIGAHGVAYQALNGNPSGNGVQAAPPQWLELARGHGGGDWHTRCVIPRFSATTVSEVCRSESGFNVWCAMAAPPALAGGVSLTPAATVMFEDRDRICTQLAEEHARLGSAAARHRNQAQADAQDALAQARAIAQRAASTDGARLEALYGEFSEAMHRHERARFEAEYGPGDAAFRLAELEHAEDWEACRRQSPRGAIPKWRHMDELTWCRDEYDTYAPMRTRLESESAWLTREYREITSGRAPAERVEAYNTRSHAFRTMNQEYGGELARYNQRCTGYRTSPTYAVDVCRNRDGGFCQR